jgi:membrane protein DedA with SNARE-associated domain
VGGVVDHVLNVGQGWLYLIIGSLVFAEDALFCGFVIPGETAAVLGGVQASRGGAHLSVVMLIVVAAAIIGDSVGFEVGRHFGVRLLNIRLLRAHQHRLSDALAFLARRGGLAVFLGRFVAFFRATMPALAGIAGMPYRKFLTFNALGGVVWGITFVSVGYAAGNSYKEVEKTVGRSAAMVVAVLVVAIIVVLRVRKHRAERAAEAEESRSGSA